MLFSFLSDVLSILDKHIVSSFQIFITAALNCVRTFAALTYMEIMKTRCDDGRSGVGTARTCVNSMVSGSLRTTLENNMEQLGGALNPPFSTAIQGEHLKYCIGRF